MLLRCEICLAQYSLYMSKEDPESRRQVEDEMAQARARNEFVDENSYRERIKKSYYACMHNNEDPQILGAPAIVFEVVSSLKNGSKGPRFLPVTFGGKFYSCRLPLTFGGNFVSTRNSPLLVVLSEKGTAFLPF